MIFIAIFDNLLNERKSGSKAVEILTGLPIPVYWATTYIVDSAFFLYVVIHITIIFYLVGAIDGAAQPYKMRDLYDVLFFYAVAQYFFVAALSQAVAKHYMPDTWIIMLAVNAICVRRYHVPVGRY